MLKEKGLEMIVIRVDDVGLNRNKQRDKGMKDYENFHKVFRDKQVPYCPAVIPYYCDLDMVKWMKDHFYSGVETILHGWNHEDRLFNGKSTEFEGLSLIEQIKRIELGVKVLHEIRPCGFSAPFNRYDIDTIKACYENGLRYFFAGYGREKEEVFIETKGCIVLPAEESFYVRGNHDILNVMDVLKNLKDRKNPYIMTLHCTWHFGGFDPVLFSDFLDVVLSKQVVSVKSINYIGPKRIS